MVNKTFVVLGVDYHDEDGPEIPTVLYAGPDEQRAFNTKDSEYYQLRVQTWSNGTLILEHHSFDKGWIKQYDIVDKIQSEIEAAKQVIADHTKVLIDLGVIATE